MKTTLLVKTSLAAVCSVLVLALAPATSYGQAGPAPESCSPEFKDQLEAKALEQATIQTKQIKNIISKPDSVLELSCFGNFVKNITEPTGYKPFSNAVVPDGQKKAMLATVGVGVSDYLNANYMHPAAEGNPANYPVGGIENQSQPVGSFQHTCNNMGMIWEIAKCGEFSDTGGFVDDQQFIQGNYDPRRVPDGGGGMKECPAARRAADLQATAQRLAVPYRTPVNTYADKLTPGMPGPAVSTGTGVACTAPGTYPSGGSCVVGGGQ